MPKANNTKEKETVKKKLESKSYRVRQDGNNLEVEVQGKSYTVRVKATTNQEQDDKIKEFGRTIRWRMGEEDEEKKSDDLFYCFVAVPKDENNESRFFIVRSKVVAEQIKKTHDLYVQSGRKGCEQRYFRLGFKDESGPIPLAKDYENKWSFNR